MIIEGKTIDELWTTLVNRIMEEGEECGGTTKQEEYKALFNTQLVLRDPTKCILMNPYRSMSIRYFAAESTLLQLRSNSVHDYSTFGKAWKELQYKGEISSAYGYRMRDKWEVAARRLRKDRFTKNAVIDLREQRDLDDANPDKCCTLTLAFSYHRETLNLTVNMRSQDVWLGLPYDIGMWSVCLQQMCYETGLPLGKITLNYVNVHLYNKDAETLKERGFNKTVFKSCVLDQYTPFSDEFKNSTWQKIVDAVARKDKDAMIAIADHTYNKVKKWEERFIAMLLGNPKIVELDGALGIYMDLAEDAAVSSRCVDRKVGCVLIDENNEVIATACNTVINCNLLCADKQRRVCNVTHAERKALEKAGKTQAHTAIVTLCPCINCAKALDEAGVKEIVTVGEVHKACVTHAKFKLGAQRV